LAKPIHVISVSPSHFVKLKKSENPSGYSPKIANKTKNGEMNR
jgi:hypothetical protein